MQELILADNSILLPNQGIDQSLYNRFFNFIDVKSKSIETYKRALRQFFKYMQKEVISRPERQDVLAFREKLKETLKPATVQAYIVAVRLFFKWLDQEGIYKNIAENIKGAKINIEHKKDSLTTNQVKTVLNNINQDTLQGKRDYAIFTLMLVGGLRTIEVNRANYDDLRTLGDNTVLYIQGKGKEEKTDYIKLPHKVEQALRAYIKEARIKNPKAPLFQSTSNNNKSARISTRTISGIIKSYLVASGYDNDRLTAHSLRHTAGTLNLKQGGTLEETQQLLRHSNINTTMIYLHHLERENNNSETRIAEAIF